MNPEFVIDVKDIEALVGLTEHLTSLIAAQARAFETHRPQDAAAGLAEVTRLANVYRLESTKVRVQPQVVAKAPMALRHRLMRATEAFDAVLERQGRALNASKSVTEGLVKAIAEEIAAKRGVNSGYGPSAMQKGGVTTAITLDRQA